MVTKSNPLEDAAPKPQNFWSSAAELWLQNLELMTTYYQPAKQVREQWWRLTLERWDELHKQCRSGLELCNQMEDQLRHQSFEACRQLVNIARIP